MAKWQKLNTCVRNFCAFIFFTAKATGEKFLTAKISQSMVYICTVHGYWSRKEVCVCVRETFV